MFNRTNFSVHRDVKLDNVTVDETSNISKLVIDASSTYVPSTPSANNVIPIDTPFTKIDSGYDWSSQPTYTIADPVEGTIKFISLLDSKMVPIKLNTSRGSIIISGSNVTGIIFNEGVWRALLDDSNPWFVDRQQGSELVGTGGVSNDSQGFSVSLSADGNTLAVGGPGTNIGDIIGSVWIYIRSLVSTGGSTTNMWSQQAILVGTGNTGTSSQGTSVSLSADGNTLAVGGPGDAGQIGATWIFIRDTSTDVWLQQGNKLVGTGNTGPSAQGTSVSLSADGNTLAVGARQDASNIGATWIFIRDTSTDVWSQQGNKLRDATATGALQGTSVSLSADGNTLAVGASQDNSNIGATWIYIRNTTTNVWSQQGSKLVGTGYSGTPFQGTTVSLSADGNTLAVGGPGDTSGKGANWIFTRSSNVPTGVWTQQGSKLSKSLSAEGTSLSLSADGNTLATGTPGFPGYVLMYTRINGTWLLQKTLLNGRGYSVSLSADGNTLATGDYTADTYKGEVKIFI